MLWRRSRKWPLWARKAFACVLAKRWAKNKQPDVEIIDSARQLLWEAHHKTEAPEAPVAPEEDSDDERTSLTKSRQREERVVQHYLTRASTYGKLMEYSAADRKDKVMPIPGNMYRWWGLGIMDQNTWGSVKHIGLLFVFVAQIFAPPACIINSLYRLDWTQFKLAWPVNMDSRVSNFSKHIVATIFLTLFTLNGVVVLKEERIVQTKIAMLLAYKDQSHQAYNKDVNKFWLSAGPIMNSLLVVECCFITYLSFVLSDTPMDVLFNATAVTFLYNLDDIAGEMGFLEDDDWDGEELGQLYYGSMDEMIRKGELQDETFRNLPEDPTPYDLEKTPFFARHSHWSWGIAESVLSVLVILLPALYVFIDDFDCKPNGMQLEVEQLKEMVQKMAGGQLI